MTTFNFEQSLCNIETIVERIGVLTINNRQYKVHTKTLFIGMPDDPDDISFEFVNVLPSHEPSLNLADLFDDIAYNGMNFEELGHDKVLLGIETESEFKTFVQALIQFTGKQLKI